MCMMPGHMFKWATATLHARGNCQCLHRVPYTMFMFLCKLDSKLLLCPVVLCLCALGDDPC